MIAHIFVDAENIPPSVTFQVVEYFGKEHTITKVDIIAKEESLPYKYRDLDEKIYRVQNCFYGKNSADTWLCIEMVRAIIDEPDLELIIIVSSDKDFLPAIKFATDFEKKVFIVSNGAGHKSLSRQLKILDIDPSTVELKDYRLGFGNVPLKLEKFLPRLSFDVKKYFFDRESRVKFILVKSGDDIVEMPFVAGMGITMFGRTLHDLGILKRSGSIREFITYNFLRVSRNRIYFHSEEELARPTQAELIENYFSEHADEMIKIFIRHNEKLHEIPFVNGMPLDLFGKFLREQQIIGKAASPIQTARKNLLKVSSGKVWLCNEEEQEKIYYDTVKNLDEYFDYHAANVKNIFIKHNGKIFEVPFVDGISLELFGKLLREKKIIGKGTSAKSIAQKNFLDVCDDKIYLCDEERLSELYTESTGNFDDYFSRHPEEKKIFVKHNGKLFEIPFVNGMTLNIFEKLLRDKNIIGKNSSAKKVAAGSLLEIRYGRVYLIDEKEMSAAQDDLELNVDAYLNEHVLEIRTISISYDGKNFSIPFVNGIPLKIFGKLLRERKIIDRKISPEEVVENNSLEIRDEKIFLLEEGGQ